MIKWLFKDTAGIIIIGWFFAIPTYILAIIYYSKQLGLI